ncbi:MAG: acyl carrier protein [Acidobacteria bacterium]|nr:acyl carrier protein [Acidobacteriota bacterium]MBP8273756.1 acyl carrier protein [Acidobacteriota bacterium]
MTAADMPQRVVAIVAEALNVPVERVTPSASLIDDLGAESIDFLDILFRLETAFNIKIRENELWGGAIDRTSQQTIEASIARLKARQPDYPWERLPAKPAASDLPRLITVQTIVHHLQERGIE